jgi:hypothetical protein
MILTLREVHVESMWTPEGIPVDSMDSPRNLFGLLMESNRMRGSVSLTLKWGGVCNLFQIYWFLFLKIATGLDSCSKNMKDGLLCKPVTGQKELDFLESE